jgi:hypothetical protein
MIQGLTGMAQYLGAAVKAFGEIDARLAASLRHESASRRSRAA